jgi:hypothetical protein
VRRLAGSDCVIRGHLRLSNEEILEHVQIHDTGNDRLVDRIL